MVNTFLARKTSSYYTEVNFEVWCQLPCKACPTSSYHSCNMAMGLVTHTKQKQNTTKSFTRGAFTLLTLRFLKSRHFDPTIYTCAKILEVSVSRNFAIFWLVVRMCDHRLQCMHSCSMHEGRGYRYTFQRARVASSPEVPKVTWWKIATFLRLPFTLANFARQLAPKCHNFSNVAKLARQCKWPWGYSQINY